MIPPFEFFRSVEAVWLIWIVSLVLLTLLIRHAFGGWNRLDFKRLLTCEDGSMYTVSYVLAFPLFMLLVCAVVQATMVLVVKMGTVYASFASARASIVWMEADPTTGGEGTRRERIKHAAVNAMTPFASSSKIHAQRLGISAFDSIDGAAKMYAHYKLYSGGAAPYQYIARKYRCAQSQTSVTPNPKSISPNDSRDNQPIEMTLKYRMPLHIPWFAKLVGHSDGILPIETRVTLAFEGARNRHRNRPVSGHPMGIPYRSP